MVDSPDPYAWKRRFDETPLEKCRPQQFNWKMFLEMLPLAIRSMNMVRQERKAGRPTTLDVTRGVQVDLNMGVPLGGLGGGTVGRGWRGDFNRWQLQPGIVHYGTVQADQFSVWAHREGEAAQAVVLNPTRPAGNYLTAWNWELRPEKASYHALFPRAWTVYNEPLPGLRLTCRQIAPVIPHNYQESSTPAGVFVWTVENTGDTAATVSIMFTFQNGTGLPNDLAGGHKNVPFRLDAPSGEVTGVELRHIHRQPRPLEPGQKKETQLQYEDPLSFAIAVQAGQGVEASYLERFVTNTNGHEVWDDFAIEGRLRNIENSRPSAAGLTIGAAVAGRMAVPAGETRQVVFSLAWDMPVARFGWGTGWYRRYTKFYGRDGNAAPKIAADSIQNYPEWEKKISALQKPILEDPKLPDWYKATLFNETYYLVDGGTIWTAGKEGDASTKEDALPEPEMGHFAYLESYEYRLYNTYDVHFYASFALAMLWPELELSLQKDFIHSLNVEHPEIVTMLFNGVKAPRKARGTIPHDLGAPGSDPWRRVNDYILQDVSRWKDLNPKFILMVYRDYLLTHSLEFLKEAWPACQTAVETLRTFDRDGDGMIENDGFPDQTYDMWIATGPSAYSGGLWLACLNAMAAMADALELSREAGEYRNELERAQAVFEGRLWNGEYYNYDSSQEKNTRGRIHWDSIMADQLAGQWYSKACGLPDIVPPEHARSALTKIFNNNVKHFFRGEAGAVNGMRPDGSIDHSSSQSEEMWAGTVFAVAAVMLQEGLVEEAFETAKGVFLAMYRDYGLFFQTPEALSIDEVYRAIGYMRPLSIWAMQWAWESSKNKPDE